MAKGSSERISERVRIMKENFVSLHDKGYSIPEIAVEFNLSGPTIYRYLGEIAEKNGMRREDLLQRIYHTQAQRLRKEEREAKASFEKVQKELGNARKSLQEVITEINKILENEEQIMSDIQENSGEGEDL